MVRLDELRLTGARLVLAGLALAGPAVSRAADVPPGFVHEQLPNGLRVSVLEDPALPLVATQVWYHVGAADEDARSRGLAHLFEHMMFGPTARFPKDFLSRHHARSGGEDNAYTTSDETVYESEIAPQGFLPILDVEAARMRGLVIDADNLENEKRIVTEELRLRTENDPITRAFITVQKAVFGEHPYAFDPSGSKEDIAAATVESCRRFYDRHYRPNNAHVIVVGPLAAGAVLSEVRSRFAAIPAAESTRAPIAALVDWEFPRDVVVVEEDLPPVETAVLGFALPPPGSADHWAIQLLLHMLTAGAVDPLHEEIVAHHERALDAGIEAFELRRGAALLFYAVSLPYRRQDTAFEHLDQALAKLSALEWLTDESLAAAKRALLRSSHEAAYFPAQLADRIGEAAWWLGDPRLAFEREERLAAVRREQVAEVWRRWVAEARPVRVYVVPENVPLWIRMFGWLYPVVN